MLHLLVVVNLETALTHARLHHAPQRDLRAGFRWSGPFPVRCPRKIRRVDVRRQSFAEAMQLVGADEVHLPAQDRLVPGGGKIMGDRGDRRAEFGAVVPHLDPRRQLTGEHRCSRRNADRKVGVRIGEDCAVRPQSVNVRRLGRSAAVGPQCECGHLIALDQQDVGASLG